MQWIEISLEVQPEKLQEAVSILEQFGQGGAVVEERQDSAEKPVSTVRIYLPDDRSYPSRKKQIQEKLKKSGIRDDFQLRKKTLRREDWFSPLKKLFDTLEIGHKFIIKPTWKKEVNSPGKIIIEMDPGMAFGTGLHATTRLCLTNLEKYIRPGDRVFDLGTGSGILAIAAAKLGASSVLALDNDPIAVRAARSNSLVNGVSEVVEVKRGTLSPGRLNFLKEGFDIVVSNITARTISDMASRLAAVLKPGGTLITSGINAPGLDEVLIRLALTGLSLKNLDREGEWYAVIASKE